MHVNFRKIKDSIRISFLKFPRVSLQWLITGHFPLVILGVLLRQECGYLGAFLQTHINDSMFLVA